MRYRVIRLAVTSLTFTLGVALVSVYLAVSSHKQIAPPVRPDTQPSAQSPAEQRTPSVDKQPQNKKPPDRLVKVGDLPDHKFDETDRFSLQFVNETVGWLANDERLWRTTDRGASWELVYPKEKANTSELYFLRFTFINARDGWLLVNNNLYRTSDGGSTWLRLPTPKDNNEFYTVEFLPDGRRGWLAGSVCVPVSADEFFPNRHRCSEGVAAVAAVYVTSDGGKTWRRQRVPYSFGGIWRLRMRGAHHGFAIGATGAFRYAGGRWLDAESAIAGRDGEHRPGASSLDVDISFPPRGPIHFHFTDGRNGWLTNSNGYIGRTTDGGRTWMDIARCPGAEGYPNRFFFHTLYMEDDGSGLALDADGSLHETWDGGVAWERVTEPGTFMGMFAPEAEKVWLVTKEGVYRDRSDDGGGDNKSE